MGHTSGPWTIDYLPFLGEFDSDGERNPDVAFIGPSELDKAVAIAFPVEDEDPYDAPGMQANARLIAAAPDLLAACEAALQTLITVGLEGCYTHEQLEAAIAKAQGS